MLRLLIKLEGLLRTFNYALACTSRQSAAQADQNHC